MLPFSVLWLLSRFLRGVLYGLIAAQLVPVRVGVLIRLFVDALGSMVVPTHEQLNPLQKAVAALTEMWLHFFVRFHVSQSLHQLLYVLAYLDLS